MEESIKNLLKGKAFEESEGEFLIPERRQFIKNSIALAGGVAAKASGLTGLASALFPEDTQAWGDDSGGDFQDQAVATFIHLLLVGALDVPKLTRINFRYHPLTTGAPQKLFGVRNSSPDLEFVYIPGTTGAQQKMYGIICMKNNTGWKYDYIPLTTGALQKIQSVSNNSPVLDFNYIQGTTGANQKINSILSVNKNTEWIYDYVPLTTGDSQKIDYIENKSPLFKFSYIVLTSGAQQKLDGFEKQGNKWVAKYIPLTTGESQKIDKLILS